MSFTIDPDILESITREARQCFLEEDAPGYLEVLKQGLQRLKDRKDLDYKELMRAAHSIKGGAGIAQMPGLSQLAHRLEDLLEGFSQQKIVEADLALEILQRGIEELTFILNQVQVSHEDLQADAELLAALDQFNHTLLAPTPVHGESTGTPAQSARMGLIKTTLEVDLENCLTRVEGFLPDAVSPDKLVTELGMLSEECNLLGEMFSLPWLTEASGILSDDSLPSQPHAFLQELAATTIAHLREQRTLFLQQLSQPKSNGHSAPATPSLAMDADADFRLPRKPNSEEPIEHRVGDHYKRLPPDESALTDASVESAAILDRLSVLPSHLRIPLKRLDQMGSVVGELITGHERLSLQQQQLKQAGQNLRRLVDQVKPIRNQVQIIYDQMSTVSSRSKEAIAGNSPEVATTAEFDSLEFDRYTALHSSLQTFEELITQIQETRVDIDLIGRELAQELNYIRTDLNQLYQDVTQSRLVPFGTFAQRFIPQLTRLNQRCQKSSELLIHGEEVLVDRVLLEQLQTPLTHLLNNALDHGIETPEQRLALDKPPVAKIHLEARTEGSEVVLTFRDDGRGIDLKRIYQKAVDRGLCPASISMNQLRREEILDFIFQSGFSTSAAVSDISGRGVGLDIVRTQVQRLRGSLEVDTLPGQGTTFTIRLPLSLSLLSLLLCQAQQQVIAIPADSVMDIVPYADLQPYSTDNSALSFTFWREQVIPVIPLMTLLPYSNLPVAPLPPRVALLVTTGAGSALALTVDSILDERQFILRSFDNTVPVPPYVAGCTILGSGEAVPVLIPRYFKPLLNKIQFSAPLAPTIATTRTVMIAEDSTGARRALEQILIQAGFSVIACRDGQEAMDELLQRQGGLDLLISDVEMPRLNGFELLQKVRTHSYWYTLPVIMLTSRTGDRHRQKAFSLGASAYLGKPITPSELMSAISSLTESKSVS